MTAEASQWAKYVLLLVLAFVGLSILALSILAAVLRVCAQARRRRQAASAVARPILQQALVEYLAGSPEVSALRSHLAKQRDDVAAALILFQSTVAGGALDRLCGLTLEFGIVQDWCGEGESKNVVRRREAISRLAYVCAYEPVRRIADDLLLRATQDPDEEVRLAAARGLLQSGGQEEIEHVFRLAIGPNQLTRVVLAEDLRRHAMELSTSLVPQALHSPKLDAVRGTLEVLVAWERAIPLDDVHEFLDNGSRAIRVLAFRLVPLMPANYVTRLSISRAIGDSDPEIRTLAVIAAGRLKMAESVAELARCMREGDPDLARHAAQALAGLPQGRETLTELSASSDPQAARAASEALGTRGRLYD